MLNIVTPCTCYPTNYSQPALLVNMDPTVSSAVLADVPTMEKDVTSEMAGVSWHVILIHLHGKDHTVYKVRILCDQ